MKIEIKRDLAKVIGEKLLAKDWDLNQEWGYRESQAIVLSRLSREKLVALQKLFEQHKDAKGANAHLRDVKAWQEAVEGGLDETKPRNLETFCKLLKRYLSAPRHWLYERDPDGESHFAYYAASVEVVHPREGVPYVMMKLVYDEFGKTEQVCVSFSYDECVRVTVTESLSRKGYYPETRALAARYKKQVDRWRELTPKIGLQMLALGSGSDDMDGNAKGREDSWYWKRTNRVALEKNGEPSRVVIDVFKESDSDERRRGDSVNFSRGYWAGVRAERPEVDEDDESDPVAGDSAEEGVQIPVHPTVAVFDLARHLRLRVHVDYLTEYAYDEKMIDKLIITDDLKKLVRVLVESSGTAFRDIVKGKSGGMVVLLAGPAGCGKTLTSEVYAETERRALYSVQCSQLGTDPVELEDELLKVFTRAKRWNAVLLLDEADVYVHERGRDMAQNAIVGVFLRVLEYQSTVLFLTTNRPQDVDDAIASRCVARLDYGYPSPEDQFKIWRVLADGSGISVSDTTIARIVDKNPKLSGRDVKNLLKLSSLMSGGAVTAESVEEAKRFKPTGPRA